jgi:ABC-type Fe3+-hydroxamate transport system substrate-binding protein
MAVHSLPVPSPNGGKAPRCTQPVSFYGQSVFSKYYAHSICAFLLLVPFLVMPVQAQAGQGPIDTTNCVTSYDANKDYFSNKIQVDDAALFSVRYEKNYKVVTNSYSGVNQAYVLTQCGTPTPNASLFPNTTLFFDVPLKNVASLATTSVAYLEMLGKRSAIKAVDTEGLTSSPCIQLALSQSEVIGLEDKNLTLRAEQFKAVDLVFSSMAPGDADIQSKTVVTSEVADPGPLNRAEWLEFYSTFFNLEESAQKLTASINNNYNCYKKAANAKPTKPIIAWSEYRAPSQFNNNTASWLLSSAPYKRILSIDAGATFFNGTTTSTFSSAAAFADALKDVDVIIDETFNGDDLASFFKSYNLTATSPHKFIQNKAIFRQDGLVNPNDGRDWFGTAVVMGDAVLQDVIRAVHPDILPSNAPYYWFRNIAKVEEPKRLVSAANCTVLDSNSLLPDRALVCGAGGSGNAGSKTVAGALTAILALVAAALAL